MKFSIAIFVVLAMCFPSIARAQADPDVVAAYEAGVQTRQQFQTVADFVRPSEKDSRWRQVPWTPDLWEAIKTSSTKKKPMFIWAMNGDPLGCV